MVQLLSGIVWWAAMTVALALAAVRGSEDRVILQALVIGGFAQILIASLADHGPTLAAALAVWLTDIVARAARLLATTRSSDHV